MATIVTSTGTYDFPNDLIDALDEFAKVKGHEVEDIPWPGCSALREFYYRGVEEYGPFCVQWVDEQREWQKRAEVCIERLKDEWPEGVLPRFFGSAWWVTLRFPWAEALDLAVLEAEAWLDEHTQ